MSKFHINSKGLAAPCRATKGRCPYGGDESHYSSLEEAQASAERENEQKFGLLRRENPMGSHEIRERFPHLSDEQVGTFEDYTQLELDLYEKTTELQNAEDNSTDEYYDNIQNLRKLALEKYAKMAEVRKYVDPEEVDKFITPHLPEKPKFFRPASYHSKEDITKENIEEGIGPVMTAFSGKDINTVKREISELQAKDGSDYHKAAVKYWNNMERRQDKPIISIDLETANPMEKGGNYDNGQLTYIIELGAVKTYPDGRVEKKNIMYGVPKEYSDINGTGFEGVHKISVEDLEGKSHFDTPENQKEMLDFMKGSVYIAHNAEFEDKQFTNSLKGYKKLANEGDIEILDTAKFSKYLIHDTEGNSNIHLVTKAGIEYKDAHRAMNDAQMTLQAFETLRTNR